MKGIEMGKAKKPTFGQRLKELREAAGLSQGNLADKAGINRQDISKYECGRRLPTWPAVQAIAVALGVSCAYFETGAKT
jgi:transcriptional regulator with XRE-family HTH domain